MSHGRTRQIEAKVAIDTYVSLGKALSDPTRMDIFRRIASEAEYACTALEKELHVSKSTISHHVKVLSSAGLISVRREGRFFFYRVERDVIDRYLPSLISHIQI